MDTWILITDTNIWIDLDHGAILTEVFRLPYRFVIPDLAVSEFQSISWAELSTLGLEEAPLEPELVLEILKLRQQTQRLSVVDLAAFVLAKAWSAHLVTGDHRLRDLANASGVWVHGVLWLLDELVAREVLTMQRAAEALNQMLLQGARLPEGDCSQRLKRWRS